MTAIAAGSITSPPIPEHRGKGHGRAIMHAAEDWLRQTGIAKMQLMVRRENAAAQAFYQSIGYGEAADDRFRQMARRPRADAVTESSRMTVSDRIRVKDVRVLSDNHYTLKTTTFEWRRGNGEWQVQHRETYDRGNGATLLPYNLAQRTVVLVRQFRYPAYVNGHDDLLIEAAAGLLDDETPEVRILAEAEEETGYRLGKVQKVFEAFMSPGSVTEKLHFFVAEYEPRMKVGSGGGIADEGEDIEVLELPIDQALAMIADGRIADAKTIMLLQYAALNIFR